MKMKFEETRNFQKDFKRLEKKYRSLSDDLSVFRNIISIIPLGNSKHFNILNQTGDSYIVKARLFCRYLKGSSLRIIYSYIKSDNSICFIELYFKGDRENENKNRIEEYLKSLGIKP
jgi:mRNA-degrading endonuclease RelE of RelBE toxin-antitoxin system